MIPPVVKSVSKKVVKYPEHNVEVISSKDWLSRFWTNPLPPIRSYLVSLFPIITWIHRYNIGWLTGDVIAGLTVGIVVVPQSMSYAQIATLPPEYGLYSSFVGVFLYCFFGTSKDVSIGPVAVMSLMVAEVIKNVLHKYPGEWDAPTIAHELALITGLIVLGIGLLRIGWVIEFIPIPAISGFMTGSAITIASGQLPGLMGITGFDTRAAPYSVIVNTLKGLPRTTLDAAFGIPGLVALYAIRSGTTWASNKWPRRARLFFFLSVMRNAFVILILTIAAWLFCRDHRDAKGNYPIKILKTVPFGLKHIAAPPHDPRLLGAMAPQLPVATIILFLEHIAIAKSFGRLNGYKINPSQELIAVGLSNSVGSCFGAYSSTGSFSRSALASKSGSRTPLGGIVTAMVVIIALYALTSAFFWIPNAGLCAIIIHAVADLVASPRQVFQYWRISPLEFIIWCATVLVTVFSSVENGIYMSIATSLAILLIRIARPRGQFLGKAFLEFESGEQRGTREVFMPMKSNGVNNPKIKIVPPKPGVIVYRLEESFLYPNCSFVGGALVDYVKENTRRGKDMSTVQLQDRPWNDNGPRSSSVLDQAMNEKKPRLHAIVLDFSSIPHLDTTATQALIDTRSEIESWTDYPVEFHFATILSPWTRRALVAGGFGYGTSHSLAPREVAAVVPYRDGRLEETSSRSTSDIEAGDIKVQVREEENSAEFNTWEPVLPRDTPFFHLDLQSAVRAAESGLERVSIFDQKKMVEDVVEI